MLIAYFIKKWVLAKNGSSGTIVEISKDPIREAKKLTCNTLAKSCGIDIPLNFDLSAISLTITPEIM